MKPPTKVLFIGIDAGDKHFIERGARDGALPAFKTLLADGLVGDTTSLDGFFVGATWPSFATGVNPARHGIHSLVQLHPGTYDLYRVDPGKAIKRPPFWEYLSREGLAVGILDVPLAGISSGLNGIQMVEWGVHDGIYGFCTWPPHLKSKVAARFGRHPLKRPCDHYSQLPNWPPRFRDLLVKGARRKAGLTLHFLKQGGWDFFAQVFSECHCVGHQCWHLHDRSHPGHAPDTLGPNGDPVLDVYAAVDAALGEILSQVGDETLVLVLASHRMVQYYGKPFLLPEILCRLHVAEPLPVAENVPQVHHPMDDLQEMLSMAWRCVPTSLKRKMGSSRLAVLDWFNTRRVQPPPSFYGVDPRRSKCFILFNGSPVAGIRVNLAGREPNGSVEPGPALDAFCEQLAQDLLEITDLDTGKPAIKGVKRTSDLYTGDHLDHLPDLLIEWNDEKGIGCAGLDNPNGSRVRIGSAKIGQVEGQNTYCRTGDHRPEGLFVARGAGLKPGRIGRTVSIMDFAPTIGALLGVGLPTGDGTPIGEIIDGARIFGGPGGARQFQMNELQRTSTA